MGLDLESKRVGINYVAIKIHFVARRACSDLSTRLLVFPTSTSLPAMADPSPNLANGNAPRALANGHLSPVASEHDIQNFEALRRQIIAIRPELRQELLLLQPSAAPGSNTTSLLSILGWGWGTSTEFARGMRLFQDMILVGPEVVCLVLHALRVDH